MTDKAYLKHLIKRFGSLGKAAQAIGMERANGTYWRNIGRVPAGAQLKFLAQHWIDIAE